MGNTRSRPINKTKISNEITNIALRKNKFGFIISTDERATDACQRQMTESTVNIDGVEKDIVCKGEARTRWMTTIFMSNYIIIIILLTLLTIYILKYNKGKNDNTKLNNIKIIITYIFILLVLVCNAGFHIFRGNTTNFQSDNIVYYFWETRKEKDQNLLAMLNSAEVKTLEDKLNLQYCKNIDLNECSNERINMFYSLQNLNEEQFKQKLPDLAQDGWEWKGYKKTIPEKIKKIDDIGIKIAKLQKKLPDGKIKVIESPFILVGANCTIEGNTCKSPKLDGTDKVKGTIDNIIATYTSSDESNIGKSIDPKIIPDNQAVQNTENYIQMTQGTPCNNRSENICEIGKDKDGIDLCEWNDTDKKCKRKWKPGRGYDVWSCDLCDDLSEKCSLKWRTWIMATNSIILSILYLIVGFISQFILKSDDENKIEYTIRSLITIFSYFMFYYMGLTFTIFNTLRNMCPDGSDMGIMGRTDTQFYYKWFVAFNPWKTADIFDFWIKEFKTMWYQIVVLITFGILATIFLSIEFGWNPIIGSVCGSLIYVLINWIMILITSSFKTWWNSNNFFMSIFIGWGIGLLGGSIWGMIEKSKDKPED